MKDRVARLVAVGLAFMLASSRAESQWTLTNVASNYMAGATSACLGNSAAGTATVQQFSNATYNPNGYVATGPAPLVTVNGSAWNKDLTATVIPNAIQYRVKISASNGYKDWSNSYSVF